MQDKTLPGEVAYIASQYTGERDYWLEKLSGEPVKSFFLHDHKRKTGGDFKMEVLEFKWSGELYTKLLEISKQLDHRLHMILAAGLTALLHKYTGSNDIIIGTPIYKQKVKGDFINTALALRHQVEEGITFKELLLHRVRPTILEANENQNYPIESLLYHLDMPVSNDEFPLFDIAVLLLNIHVKQYLRHITLNMIFSFLKTAESIEGSLEYNSLLYKKATVERIIKHFSLLLQQVLFNLNIKLNQLDILSPEEKRAVLFDFNNTTTSYSREKTIDELFEEQAVQAADKIALTFAKHSLTYKELNERSTGLAAYLRHKGVDTEEPVGIMAEESFEMIMGVIAILKAGGAYLPINNEYPEERKNYLLKDGNIKILLAACQPVPQVVPEVVYLYESDIYKADGAFQRHHGCNNLAYIIYTSGSTGQPKGIMVKHRNVVRLVKNTNYVELTENDRVLQTGALEFDASTFEIWGPLLNGLPLHTAGKETILASEDLEKLIRENKITTMWMTSPLFNQMLDTDIGIFMGLRNLLVGGDVLSPLHINRLRAKYPHLNVINGYGPTENTTFSTTFLVDREYKYSIPIGKPIANSAAYILDRTGKPVTIGIQGELYVGGDGVARGYLNNPELTADNFVNAEGNGSRLYRTGDLCRWLDDGNIEFLGRIDHQLKIRGFRIEPGEIETCLLDIETVREAVVINRTTANNEKYLCAYIVPKKDVTLDITEIRNELLRRLPDYMVPTYFVPLETIPLTTNGKVDVKTLPEPEVKAGQNYAAPRNELEKRLVEIWSDVLKVEAGAIGIDDDFFELGGHSLKATILTAKLHRTLDVKVPLAEIFRIPTIRELAQCINGIVKEKFVSIDLAEEKDFYILSSTQKRLYFLQQMNLSSTNYNVSLVVEVEGRPDRKKLEDLFHQLIERHESFRTSFEMFAEEPVQKIHDPGDIEFEIEYYDITGKSPITSLIRRFIRPFDLSKAPLLRLGLIHTPGGDNYILMVDMHHIVTDGTSMELLVKEFTILWDGEELPSTRLRYKDFSEWQNSETQKNSIKKQEKYWLNTLKGDIPILNIPGDYPRPRVQSTEGSVIGFRLGEEETRILRNIALDEGATLFIVLLAIYNILLGKLGEQEDILVGSPIACRRHADLEQIVGMFVNTLVFRNYPRGSRKFAEFLAEVKENTISAFENQDYPFADLVEKVLDERDLSHNPLFDVRFKMNNFDPPANLEQSLKVKPYQYENNTSKFDMTLMVVENVDTLDFEFEYCTKIFKEETIKRFFGYYRDILSAVMENRNIKLEDIAISVNSLTVETDMSEIDLDF